MAVLFVSGSTGFGYSYPEKDFLVAKYHANGSLDSSFGTYGITTSDFSGNSDISYSSALQPDGKIVLAGLTGDNANFNNALTRYNNATIYPLQLLTFTAIKKEAINLLQWQTAQEINTSGFSVEKSGDGNNYLAIGYVQAGSNPYQFTDSKPFTGNNYYRLKMMNTDGKFTYSPVRMINKTGTFMVKVYPNPVKNKLQVRFDSDKDEVVQWSIIAGDGKAMLAGQWQVLAGNTTKDIQVASLQNGHYYLLVTNKAKEQSVVTFEKL